MAVSRTVAPCSLAKVHIFQRRLLPDHEADSETSINFYQTEGRNKSEDNHLQTYVVFNAFQFQCVMKAFNTRRRNKGASPLFICTSSDPTFRLFYDAII
jgi:hypothetical protein